MTSFPGQPR